MRKTPAKSDFVLLLKEIKTRISQAQTRAVFAVNSELVRLYWDIGRIIDERQQRAGWGAGVIPRLARELKNELPDEKGFSQRNIKRMLAFFRAYAHPNQIVPQAAAQLPGPKKGPLLVIQSHDIEKVPQGAAQLQESILWSIPGFHHVVLLEKIKDIDIRIWYMEQTLTNGWSRNVLQLMIKSEAHVRQGQAVTNFDRLLPAPQSDLARQTLKDPYIFDFLTLDEPFHERELEIGLLHEVEHFLLELGQGFAFVGRQYPLKVGEKDFYVDLLFYHLQLRCFVVIDLKKGEFKPEYAGKMNFYLGVVDDKLRHSTDQPSIGLILCQDRNQIIAEYALRDMSKPIGVSEYELTRALPESLRSALPTVEQIENEFRATEFEDATPQATASVNTTQPSPSKKPTPSKKRTSSKKKTNRKK